MNVSEGTLEADGIGAYRGRLTAAFDMQANDMKKKQDDQLLLLPGIPNQITLSEITSKLPWAAFEILPSVSRGWQQAIKSGEARSMETFVVLKHNLSGYDEDAISLYSTRDKCSYQLPPIPDLDRGIPRFAKCVTLDGKIYIIGGLRRGIMGGLPDFDNDPDQAWLERVWEGLHLVTKGFNNCYGVEVYVLDVAGRKQWKQCASMQEPRKGFGCGVLDGKIYVFGGTRDDSRVPGSEVYDPKADTWSTIAQMRSVRFGHSIAAVGEELFVYGGWMSRAHPVYGDLLHEALSLEVYHAALSLEVYHPVNNEWRVIDPFGMELTETMFMARGRFCSMNSRGISVHGNDLPKKTWTDLHSFSLPQAERIHAKSYAADERPVLAVDDELLVISPWHNSITGIKEVRLLQSKGFGSKKKELVWEEANCSLNFTELSDPPFLCPLQLRDSTVTQSYSF